jgi:Leucine-rich repeat (LRR) protein
MNFPNNINPEPGYYNITGPLITNPIPIDLNNNNIDDFELGLYLNNNYFNNQDINNFLPFPINLSEIDCVNNYFSEFPPLPEDLQWLNIKHNNFSQLPILPNELEFLFCDNNRISSINSLPTQLITLECSFNGLVSLPEQLPVSLEILNLNNNLLINLPPLHNLEELSCSINNLIELPDLPETLKILECHNNSIQNIPYLPPNLEKLDCENNSLTTLPIFPESLRLLFCRGNNFDEETVSRIIQFYEKAINNNYTRTYPSFQEELDYFTTRRSLTTSYSLENQDVELPPDVINEIREHANLRLPRRGGKKTLNKKKSKKGKQIKKKKTMKKRQRK